MLHLRYLIRPLVAVAVLATAVSLAASSVAAQEPRVFRFMNTELEDSDWEVRVTVDSFGGCGDADGRGGGASGWLEPGEEWGDLLDLDCSYTITAVARNQDTQRGKICDALLEWSDGSDGRVSNGADELRTRDTARGTRTDVRIEHDPNGGCDAGLKVTFFLEPDDVVEPLPSTARDSGLEDRAERAVEVAEFDIRITPHSSTKNRRGCDQLHRFTMSGGDDGEYEQEFPGIPVGTDCTFVVTMEGVQAPFRIVDTDGTSFRTGEVGSDGVIDINLSDLVELPWGRIAIIQDVTGSKNQGHVAYKVTRSCAGIDALPPAIVGGGGPGIFTLPGGQVVATLSEGRFTVHSANFANFGAGANYLAIARSVRSSVIDGCAVSVTVQNLPKTCTVGPSAVQSLSWRSATQFDHYDFEFDINCSGQPGAPAIDTGLPPAPPGTIGSGTDTVELEAVSESADVRIIARRLPNGKIEFGLEQRQDDDSWGGRRLPRSRLFPATAAAGRWLVSNPVTLTVAESDDALAGEVDVRIVARRRNDDRVEFGLQQRENGSWSERVLPTRRFFPLTATENRWLASTTITLDD